MEERRTGSSRYFPTPEAGWLSCAVAVRGRAGQLRLADRRGSSHGKYLPPGPGTGHRLEG